MPELPEVETVVRSVAPHIVGATVQRAEVRSKRVTRADFAQTEAALAERRIIGIRRIGKQILIDLDNGAVLYVHLGMTGKLLWNGDPGKYTRALLELDRGLLIYDDVRQFGRFELLSNIAEKGPDALDVLLPVFLERMKKHRGTIKSVLLNQAFIAGVGNIYADEVLFAARVHPKTLTGRISTKRATLIHQHVLEILQSAVALRGSSISDYVDASGARGEFQQLHRVYGRAGKACPNCGTAIRRIVVAQRGTHYCPRCQRA